MPYLFSSALTFTETGIMDESVQIVRQQLEDVYEKQIFLPNFMARKTHRDKLKMRARDFLDLADPSERLDAVINHVLLDQSATISSWGSVSRVMLCMEQYAINLLNCPWKKEFHKILTYSGFYKTRLKSCLHDSALEKLFSIIWYQRTANSFVLKSSPPQSVLVRAALSFYLAAIECENYNKVHAVFESRGLSTVGAMQFRYAHHGSIQTCCDIIIQRYGSHVEEQCKELKGRSVVRPCSVDMDTGTTVDEWKDPPGTNHSAAVENNPVWNCTGTIEEHAEISRELLTELQPQYKNPRERRRDSKEVAEDFEQLKLEEGHVVSAFDDSASYKSFSNKDEHLSQFYDKSVHKDHPKSEISKEQHPIVSPLPRRGQGQTSYLGKGNERLDRNLAGSTEEIETDKEYCHFASIQDHRTNLKLEQNQKTNRLLSVNDQSHQVISEKRERSKRLKRSATQKSGGGKGHQSDKETGNPIANVAQCEMPRDSESHDLNLEQPCSDGMVQWQCGACTLVNKPSESVCRACNRSRHVADEKPLATGSRQCNQCTFVNPSLAEKCEICEGDLVGSSTYI